MTSTERHPRSVGFIGLGEQGAPMARRIAQAGWPLWLWARKPAALAPFEELGIQKAASPAALGEACDIVGVCVMNDDDVRQVLLGDGQGVLSGMRPGGIVVVHSTTMPETVVELAREARTRGIDLLDAPVSGRAAGAIAGTLTVMVGGEAEPFARARPVMETFASTIAHLGPVGSGQACKLLCNNVCFANMAIGLHALDLAEALGMTRETTAQMLMASSASSFGFKVGLERLAEFGHARPGSAMGKDQRHFEQLLADRGVEDGLINHLSRKAVLTMRADEV